MSTDFLNPPASLLLIKPGSMGDVIHALPVADAIHRAWPDTEITWVVDPRWMPLLEQNPAISRIHPFPRSDFRGMGFLQAIKWYRKLRDLRAELVLDLQCLLRSGLMAFCSGSRRVVGLSDAREGAGFFYTDSVPVEKNEHAVTRYLRSLSALGIPRPEDPEWFIPPGRPCSAFDPAEPYVVLHPFARGAGKSLDAESIAAFVDVFLESSPLRIVLVGVGDYSADHGPRCVNLLGKTDLSELIGILRGAQFVASVDSGPMHLAAALGVRLLSIHTWSDPRRVGPYSNNAWIWQGGEIRKQDLSTTPLPEQVFTVRHAQEAGRFVASGGLPLF